NSIARPPPRRRPPLVRTLGTRTRQNSEGLTIDQGSRTRRRHTDKGMSKRAQASVTFASATGRVTGPNGTFANFKPQDPLEVFGTNLNNGFFEIFSIDAVNQAYMVLDPPPKDEGPIVCVLRTP